MQDYNLREPSDVKDSSFVSALNTPQPPIQKRFRESVTTPNERSAEFLGSKVDFFQFAAGKASLEGSVSSKSSSSGSDTSSSGGSSSDIAFDLSHLVIEDDTNRCPDFQIHSPAITQQVISFGKESYSPIPHLQGKDITFTRDNEVKKISGTLASGAADDAIILSDDESDKDQHSCSSIFHQMGSGQNERTPHCANVLSRTRQLRLDFSDSSSASCFSDQGLVRHDTNTVILCESDSDKHLCLEEDSSAEAEWIEEYDRVSKTSVESADEDSESAVYNVIIMSDDEEASATEDLSQSIHDDVTDGKKAKNAKQQFIQRRDLLGKQYFDEFNYTVFSNRLSGVGLSWSKTLRTTAGYCKYGTKKNEKFANIELSTKVIDEDFKLRNTLMHEMCHAAAWIVDGVSNPPHGKCFRKWGALAMRTVSFHFYDTL